MTESTYDSIIICGKRHKLKGVKVVTWEDPDGFSFPRAADELKLQGLPPMFRPRFKKKPIPPMNFDQVKEVVSQVIIHTDLTSDSSGCFRALVGRRLSTHFMIDWDGTIYQALDIGYQAYHAGTSEVNSASIGLDMNNPMRNLIREPSAPPYPHGHPALETRKGGVWPHKRPRRFPPMRINGGLVQSYGYTDPQYRALITLLAKLTEEDLLSNIKRNVPFDAKGEVIPNVIEDFEGFQGILGHWHVSATRWDPGPQFDWQRLYSGLVSENNSFPLLLEQMDNVGALLEKAKVLQQAERLFARNESGLGAGLTEGGWFPMGPNQTWHGGIHLQAKKGTEVLSMFEGKLVAARFNRKQTKIGSPNFIVLRHEIEIPGRKKEQKKKLVFFSLYMHLEHIDVDMFENRKRFEWLGKIFERDEGAAKAEEAGLGGEDKGDPEVEGARLKDGEGLSDDERAAVEEDRLEADEFTVGDDDPYLTKPTRQGPGLGFLRRGDIAWFDWQEPDNAIVVGSARAVGLVGEFDGKRQVHVEVFADDSWKDAIDLAVHGEYFTEIKQTNPADRSLFVKNRGLVQAFSPSGYSVTKNSLVKDRVLAPSEIADVFTMDDPANVGLRKRLRKIVAYSMSEWSDQVDWVTALTEAQKWPQKRKDFIDLIKKGGIFRDALEKVLPYVWLNAEVADKIGLQNGGDKWTGHLWHFHPLHFLIWLTFHSARRVQVLSRSVSKKKLKELREIEEKLDAETEETAAYRPTRGFDYGATIDSIDVEYFTIDEVLQDFFLESPDQSEWRNVRGVFDDT